MTSVSVRQQVAVVEDDPFMAQMVSDMLSSADVDVEIFGHGEALFQSANLRAFKTLVLDMTLPDMDGFDMMERLAAHAIGVSVVLISGHDQAVVRGAKLFGKGVGLHMRGALTKPFARDELLLALGLPQ